MAEALSFNGDPEMGIVHLCIRKAELLVKKSRDRLRELLLDSSIITYEEIAAELIPDSYAISIDVSRRIISFAAKTVLSMDELQLVVKAHMSEGAKRAAAVGGFSTGGESMLQSIRSRGQEPWSDYEREIFLELATLPEFRHPEKSNKPGKPCYAKIAPILNEWFHQGREVRKAKTLYGMRVFFLDKIETESGVPRARQNYTPWSEQESQRFKELISRILWTSGTQVGKPDYERIATILNQEFHSEALASGVAVRKRATCNKRANP